MPANEFKASILVFAVVMRGNINNNFVRRKQLPNSNHSNLCAILIVIHKKNFILKLITIKYIKFKLLCRDSKIIHQITQDTCKILEHINVIYLYVANVLDCQYCIQKLLSYSFCKYSRQ